ncbi:imidazoleglycerol-phosphate dehydratase HisB [Tuberibacillus calidus]|uniref:imidazoleglycerol-phosphate dehydratase HisB n=1 Tax=Tuberibacillus calidus TaxID=340097 RepID=UPI0003FB2186|nr:imidazoleglycerol-phosphate dehydratase HisB [Tuberibacillus calidus]
MRQASKLRKTCETAIEVTCDLDDDTTIDIKTGIGFFDHMLTALARHGRLGLKIKAEGDLDVDGHHTVEDIGIVLGQALREALGDKRGINRYGACYVPMDETLAFVAVDVSGRPYLHFDAEFKNPKCGDFDTELTKEFFRAFSNHAGITLHAKILYGENTHHKIEALFKACGRALCEAVTVNPAIRGVNSTKGMIE